MTTNSHSRSSQRLAPLGISYVADFYRRYPGETVTFYTRVDAGASLPGIIVKVTMPPGLELGAYRAPPGHDDGIVSVDPETGESHLVWNVAGRLPAGTRYEYEAEARIAPTTQDRSLRSRAVVISAGPSRKEISVEETATIVVSAKGKYLDYLPAIYHDDELMGRFLMLFESFWAPIERQIGSQTFYFDPRMTPPDLLPWLASWVGLELDERWPEEKQRRLLRSATSLYRKRGTRRGLQEYLEIYTGEKVQIIEHRSHNFRLGPEAKLGRDIALGTENVPHNFTVNLRLPPAPSPEAEAKRRGNLQSIIESQMPAHTTYTLRIESKA